MKVQFEFKNDLDFSLYLLKRFASVNVLLTLGTQSIPYLRQQVGHRYSAYGKTKVRINGVCSFSWCHSQIAISVFCIISYLKYKIYLIASGIFIHKKSATSIPVSISSEYSNFVISFDVLFLVSHLITACK